jgi:hypothetical protein
LYILLGKPKRKGPLGKPGRRRKNNIKICQQEIGYGVDWIALAQYEDKHVFSCEHGNKPWASIKCEEILC